MINFQGFEVEFSCQLIPSLQGLTEGEEEGGFWVFRRDSTGMCKKGGILQ